MHLTCSMYEVISTFLVDIFVFIMVAVHFLSPCVMGHFLESVTYPIVLFSKIKRNNIFQVPLMNFPSNQISWFMLICLLYYMDTSLDINWLFSESEFRTYKTYCAECWSSEKQVRKVHPNNYTSFHCYTGPHKWGIISNQTASGERRQCDGQYGQKL